MANSGQKPSVHEILVAAHQEVASAPPPTDAAVNSLLDLFGFEVEDLPDDKRADVSAILVAYGEEACQEFGRVLETGLLTLQTADLGPGQSTLAATPDQMAAPHEGDNNVFYAARHFGEVTGESLT